MYDSFDNTYQVRQTPPPDLITIDNVHVILKSNVNGMKKVMHINYLLPIFRPQ